MIAGAIGVALGLLISSKWCQVLDCFKNLSENL
jgi:hypothetical protein